MEFLSDGSVCAIAAGEKATDLVYFILVIESLESIAEIEDGYGHKVPPCTPYIVGYYLGLFGGKKRKQQSNSLSSNEQEKGIFL